jgi:hypothetical protein
VVVVNGCPKSGTHAAMALLDRMGLKRCPGTILGTTPGQKLHVAGSTLDLRAASAIPDNCYILGHVCAAHSLDGFPVVTVFRDPRNVLVSYCRHRAREGVAVTIPQALADFWGAPFTYVYRGFLGWFGVSMILRYEHLPEKVAGDGAGIYNGQAWNTRTGAPSFWEDWWSAEAERAWVAHGGPSLLSAAGYR